MPSDPHRAPHHAHDLTDWTVPQPDELFAPDNPEPRCPCLLLLDRSGSMRGAPIAALNEGLQRFRDAINRDELAAKRVEVAIVSFGPVTTEAEFVEADRFVPPTLEAGGDTPMGEAIRVGLDLLERRKAGYREQGLAYYRPWAFLITDGAPTDAWQEAADRVRADEESRKLAFFAVGVGGADMDRLARISLRAPQKLDGLEFGRLFEWLSRSLKAVSRSQVGTQVQLPPPDWTSV